MLVERHGGMVHRTCQRILGDAAAAEDAAQATFLVLARRARQVSGEIGGFLHGVAVKIATRALSDDRLRKVRERQAGELRKSAHAAGAAGGDNAAEGARAWQEIEPVLDESIERLPARQRQALVLFYLEGRPQADVAKRMGLDRSAVTKQIQHALERLRRYLSRRGYGAELESLLADTTSANATAATAATTDGPAARRHAGVAPLAAVMGGRLGGSAAGAGCPSFLSRASQALAQGGSKSFTGSIAAGNATSVVHPAARHMAEGALRMIRIAQIKTACVTAAATLVLAVGVSAAVAAGLHAADSGGQAVAPGIHSRPVTPPAPVVPNELDLATVALNRKLETPINLSVNNVSDMKVWQTFARESGINIVLDPTYFRDITNARIKLMSFPNVKASQFLRLALQTLSTDAEASPERGVEVIYKETRHGFAAKWIPPPEIDNAKFFEQSPTEPWSDDDRKVLKALDAAPGGAVHNMKFGTFIKQLSVATRVSIAFEGNLSYSKIDDQLVSTDPSDTTQWEALADAVTAVHLAWRLDHGDIVLTDRGTLTKAACLARNTTTPANEVVRKKLLKLATVEFDANTPLAEALKWIAAQTGATIVYESPELEKKLANQTAPLDVTDLPLRDVLEFTLRQVGASYRIEDGKAVIYSTTIPPMQPAPPTQAVSAAGYGANGAAGGP
ncbi:MAG: RNA polymerase sigma factor [Planctomycetota bacterium]